MPSREDDGSDSDGSFWRFRPDRDDAASAAVTPESAREDDDARARRPPAAAAAAAARRRAKSAPEAAAAERLVAQGVKFFGRSLGLTFVLLGAAALVRACTDKPRPH